MLLRFSELASEEIVRQFMSTVERAEKAQQKSYAVDSEKRGLSNEGGMDDIMKNIADVTASESVKQVDESEPIDKYILTTLANISEKIGRFD